MISFQIIFLGSRKDAKQSLFDLINELYAKLYTSSTKLSNIDYNYCFTYIPLVIYLFSNIIVVIKLKHYHHRL